MIDIKHSIFDFNPQEWNACVPDNHPFLKFEFYQALEESKCVGAEIGWIPFYLSFSQNGGIDAILPIYLKNHSYGEFIFDWSWAQAYERYGLNYYPKLTSALPHTPVSAPKLITRKDISISTFIECIAEISNEYKCSSTHLLFTSKKETEELQACPNYLHRHSIQYHFQNKNFDCFEDFLSTLRKDKRKNFKKERKAILENTSITINQKQGNEINIKDAHFMHTVYMTTIQKKWSQAYLNKNFFERWFDLQKDQMLYIEAVAHNEPIAAAIHLMSDTKLFGRYWGCTQEVPYLHFELCYYQAIEFAIKNKLAIVEAGAQGEQKLVRGFEPVIIDSFHKIENESFATAISAFLIKEKSQLNELKFDLEEKMLPFKRSNDQ